MLIISLLCMPRLGIYCAIMTLAPLGICRPGKGETDLNLFELKSSEASDFHPSN